MLALASIGATYDNIARTGDQATFAAPGKLYDVGGHRLHLDCHGHGSPTVVLSNGLGEVSASWARITAPVAATTRVCAYDRAGQGWSDEAASPQDGVQSAEDLHTLLAEAGEHGPYVLVGHSTGGTYAMTYAARYPEQVAGLVLLDSSSPEQFTRMPAYPGQYAVMRRAYALLPTLSRLGLGHLVPATSHLPAADAARVTAITSAPQAYRNQRDEVSVIPEVFAQAQALTTFGNRPLAVLTASATSTGTDGWVGAQDQLAALSPNSCPPHRRLHPHRPARGRPPGRGFGPRHHRGHLLGPHQHAASQPLTRRPIHPPAPCAAGSPLVSSIAFELYERPRLGDAPQRVVRSQSPSWGSDGLGVRPSAGCGAMSGPGMSRAASRRWTTAGRPRRGDRRRTMPGR